MLLEKARGVLFDSWPAVEFCGMMITIMLSWLNRNDIYRQTSNIRRILVSNKIIAGAAPTTSSFST